MPPGIYHKWLHEHANEARSPTSVEISLQGKEYGGAEGDSGCYRLLLAGLRPLPAA